MLPTRVFKLDELLKEFGIVRLHLVVVVDCFLC